MVQIKINNQDYQLATSLRVIYELKNMLGCKTLQDALKQVQTLDLDNQIKLLYVAYKYGKNVGEQLTESQFTDLVLDYLGIRKISSLLTDIIDGFMYAGLTDKELEEAKKEVAEVAKKRAGATSSDTDIA